MYYRLQNFFSKLFALTGVTDYFWRRLPNGLYVFNYHRVGDAAESNFDHAIFSCSTTAFNQQVEIFKKNFTIINCQQLADIVEQGKLNDKRYAIITFDDGYLDNYLEAYPVLKKHGVSASFYIPTDFIDSKYIPWWDEIAYILRSSSGSSYTLPETDECFHLEAKNIDNVIRQIMNTAKSVRGLTTTEVLEDIREKFPVAAKKIKAQTAELFMSWAQIKTMAHDGMEIGSHTVSHRILSQLSDEEQLFEITHSKKYLEEKLSQPVISIAYPVGRDTCYNQTSFKYVKSAHYQIAFNNEPGSHRSINNIYDINRFCVARDNLDYLKYECCFKS